MTQWTISEPPVSSLQGNVAGNARDAGTLLGDDLSVNSGLYRTPGSGHLPVFDTFGHNANSDATNRLARTAVHTLQRGPKLIMSNSESEPAGVSIASDYEEVRSPQTQVSPLTYNISRFKTPSSSFLETSIGAQSEVNALAQQDSQYYIPGAEALSAFEDSHVPRLVSLSFAARAQASFKEMVEASHLYAGPLFSAIGRFIQDDGSVLQCLAYQRRPVPDHQYDIPSLGSCVDDLCFDFHERLVDGLNPSAPNWVSLQELTTSHMSPRMKQALWSLSRVVLSDQFKELEGGFFTCLHQTRELRTIQNGEQFPVYSVRPAALDAVFIFELNQGFWPQILRIYQKEFRLGMCNLLEDWLMVVGLALCIVVGILNSWAPHYEQSSWHC
ncbi:hypothetical protein B0H14DRAFT_2803096 [Mycena olivaceomarginata]|nr:hypothetical protein B0H14DRAFT_2803096 [Mycena olivaceomarginata]